MLQLVKDQKYKATNVERYFKEFYQMYRADIQNLHDVIYNDEVIRDKSNEGYRLQQYYLAFDYVTLMYLDYIRSGIDDIKYYNDKYEITKYRKMFACNNIDIDAIFKIFGLTFISNATFGIGSASISNTLTVGAITTIQQSTTTIDLLTLIDKGTRCINLFKPITCQILKTTPPITIGIEYVNGLTCGAIILDKEVYQVGDNVTYGFTIINEITVDIETTVKITDNTGLVQKSTITIPKQSSYVISNLTVNNIQSSFDIIYTLGVYCMQRRTVSVEPLPDLPEIITTITLPQCHDEPCTITIQNYTSSYNYTLHLDNEDLTLVTDNDTLVNGAWHNIVAGIYAIRCRDLATSRETILHEVEVGNISEITITSLTVTDASTPDAEDGTITVVSIGGGTQPHKYTITKDGIEVGFFTGTTDGTNSTYTFTDLAQGTYQVKAYNFNVPKCYTFDFATVYFNEETYHILDDDSSPLIDDDTNYLNYT